MINEKKYLDSQYNEGSYIPTDMESTVFRSDFAPKSVLPKQRIVPGEDKYRSADTPEISVFIRKKQWTDEHWTYVVPQSTLYKAEQELESINAQIGSLQKRSEKTGSELHKEQLKKDIKEAEDKKKKIEEEIVKLKGQQSTENKDPITGKLVEIDIRTVLGNIIAHKIDWMNQHEKFTKAVGALENRIQHGNRGAYSENNLSQMQRIRSLEDKRDSEDILNEIISKVDKNISEIDSQQALNESEKITLQVPLYQYRAKVSSQLNEIKQITQEDLDALNASDQNIRNYEYAPTTLSGNAYTRYFTSPRLINANIKIVKALEEQVKVLQESLSKIDEKIQNNENLGTGDVDQLTYNERKQIEDQIKQLQDKIRTSSSEERYIVDPTSGQEEFNGVIELANVSGADTTTDMYGSGSASFTIENPNNVFYISKADIDLSLAEAYALSDAKNNGEKIKVSGGGTLTKYKGHYLPDKIIGKLRQGQAAAISVTDMLSSLSVPVEQSEYSKVEFTRSILQKYYQGKTIFEVMDRVFVWMTTPTRTLFKLPDNQYATEDSSYLRYADIVRQNKEKIKECNTEIERIKPILDRGNNKITVIQVNVNKWKKGDTITLISELNEYHRALQEEVRVIENMQQKLSSTDSKLGTSTTDLASIKSKLLYENSYEGFVETKVQVFQGLIKSVSQVYSDGVFKIKVSCNDNLCFLEMSRIMVKPALRADGKPKGVLQDPIWRRGELAGYWKNGIVALDHGLVIDEVQAIKDKKINITIIDSVENVFDLKKRNNISESEGNETVTPYVTTLPFAKVDAANLVSFIITGIPYNVESFARNAVFGGQWITTQDVAGQVSDKNSYFASLKQSIGEQNDRLGNFEPYLDVRWVDYLKDNSTKLKDEERVLSTEVENAKSQFRTSFKSALSKVIYTKLHQQDVVNMAKQDVENISLPCYTVINDFISKTQEADLVVEITKIIIEQIEKTQKPIELTKTDNKGTPLALNISIPDDQMTKLLSVFKSDSNQNIKKLFENIYNDIKKGLESSGTFISFAMAENQYYGNYIKNLTKEAIDVSKSTYASLYNAIAANNEWKSASAIIRSIIRDIKDKKISIGDIDTALQMTIEKIVKGNYKNFLVISDRYSYDFSIQAYVAEIAAGNSYSIWENEYEVPLTLCRRAAEQVNFEFFADSQGNLQFKPPSYNRILKEHFPQISETDTASRNAILIYFGGDSGIRLQEVIKVQSDVLQASLNYSQIKRGYEEALKQSEETLQYPRPETSYGSTSSLKETPQPATNSQAGLMGIDSFDYVIYKNSLQEIKDKTQTDINYINDQQITAEAEAKKENKETSWTVQDSIGRRIAVYSKALADLSLRSKELSNYRSSYQTSAENFINKLSSFFDEHRIHRIADYDLVDYELSEKPPRFTYLEVLGQGELVRVFDGAGDTYYWAGGTDYDNWRNYGFLSESMTKAYFQESAAAKTYCRAMLGRERGRIFSGRVTVRGDSKFQLGDCIFLEDQYMYYYIVGISHSFRYGDKYTTTLQLEYGRRPGELIPHPFDVLGKIMIDTYQSDLEIKLAQENAVYRDESKAAATQNTANKK